MRVAKLYSILSLFVAMLLLPACLVEIEYLPTRTALPTVSATATLSPTSPTSTAVPTQTKTPTPTVPPEPVTFEVGENHDMFSIALFYGISLEALKTANPEVNPNAMGIGTILQIPITPTAIQPPSNGEQPNQTPTPTSGLRLASTPRCYLDALAGLACLVEMANESEEAVENPAVRFRLTNPDGSQAEAIAFAPLNILRAKVSLPVYAYFPGPFPEAVQAEAWIESWLPTMPEDNRYALAEFQAQYHKLSDDGMFAEVSGLLMVDASDDKPLASVWVLVTAYNAEGEPIGLRRWEATPPLDPEGGFKFMTLLYSLGDPIDYVIYRAEARYLNP